MNQHSASSPWLVARGHRFNGLQRVDLFWGGSGADGFDIYRDGQRIATVAASPYHDRLDRSGAGSYRYQVAEVATATRSNDAAVTFTDQGTRAPTNHRPREHARAGPDTRRIHRLRARAGAAENELGKPGADDSYGHGRVRRDGSGSPSHDH